MTAPARMARWLSSQARAAAAASRPARAFPLAALAAVAAMAAVAACDEYIVDSETPLPPRVTDFALTPDSLDLTDAGDTAVASIGARAGGGLDSVRVTFRGPGGDLQRQCVAVTPETGEPAEGTWACELPLDRHDPAGSWSVVGLGLIQEDEVVLDIDSTALAEAGYPRVIDVVRRPLALEAVAVERDTVSAYEDTARVPLRASFTGPRLDSVSLVLARGEVFTGCTTESPVEGDRGTGSWRCEAVIPQGASSGDWALSTVTAYPTGLDPAPFGPDTLASFGPPVVTVAPPPVDFVIVRTDRDTLTSPGDTTRATATAYDRFERVVEGVTFDWTSTDTAVAAVDGQGLVTARAEGGTWIRAETAGVADSTRMTVDFASPVDSVALTPAADTILDRGDTTRLTFSAYDSTGAPVTAEPGSWWSAEPAVATVDSMGLVTSVAGGQTTIFAAVETDTAAATIDVPPVDFVVVSPYADTLYSEGDTTQYQATAFTRFERIIGGIRPRWSSTDTTVAVIDSTGLATAVGPDSTDIVATMEGVSTTRPLWVVVVDSIAVSPSSYFFEFMGHQQQFTATALGPAGDTIGADITWSSTDTTIVDIDASGLATAVGHGTAEIHARAGTVVGVSDVTSDVVTAIVVEPSVDTLTAVGETAQYTATAYADETTVVENVDFTWSTGNAAVATVDSTGLVTAVDSGSTQVTATALFDQGSATVEVVTRGPQFSLTDLGWLETGPGPEDIALGVSRFGQVAGMARNDAGDDVPFWWNADQGMLPIPTFPGADSIYGAAYDINGATFAIVGESTHESGTLQAFYFIPHDSLVAIGDLEGLGSWARAVNDSLAIVGGSMTSSGQEHAFLWTEEAGMQDLGTLGGAQSIALDINYRGTVVGHSWVAADQPHAFVWTAETGMQDLGTLGGATSYATGINPDDFIVGHAEDAEGNMRAVVWAPPYDGAPVDLGTLGGAQSFGWDLSSDRAVGLSETETGALVPTVYFGDGGLTAVEVEGAIVEALRAINGNQQMAGAATIDGVRRAVRIEANY
ncbi:MAG: Ig-like domain-containing protein [Longimicrobiales bacterium]